MKPLVILGSIVGFLIGGGFSLLGDCPWPTAVWRACAAALAAAMLTRWWSRIWLQSLADTLRQRRLSPSHEVKPTLKPATKL